MIQIVSSSKIDDLKFTPTRITNKLSGEKELTTGSIDSAVTQREEK